MLIFCILCLERRKMFNVFKEEKDMIKLIGLKCFIGCC